jgi:hypothetical protein
MKKDKLKNLISIHNANKYYKRIDCDNRPYHNLLKQHYVKILLSYAETNVISFDNNISTNNNTQLDDNNDIRDINIHILTVPKLQQLCLQYSDIKDKIFLVNKRQQNIYGSRQFMKLLKKHYKQLITMYIDKKYNNMTNDELDTKYYK